MTRGAHAARARGSCRRVRAGTRREACAPKQPGGGWWRSARKSGEGRDRMRDAASAAPAPAASGRWAFAAVVADAGRAWGSSAYCGEKAWGCEASSAIACCVLAAGAADCGRVASDAVCWSIFTDKSCRVIAVCSHRLFGSRSSQPSHHY